MRWLALLSLAALSACSGGGDSGSPSPVIAAPTPAPVVVPPPPPPPATALSVLTNLETSGAIPKLDRSADLKGPDANNNGIRDDIDEFLAKKNFSAKVLKGAQQEARVIQDQLLVNPSNKTAVQAIETRANNSSNCLFSLMGKEAISLSSDLQKYTANTKARMAAYLKYDQSLNGTVASAPDGDTCE